MPAVGNLPPQPVSSPPTQWKMGKDGLEYPVYDDDELSAEDDDLSDDDDDPFPTDDDDDNLLDYYPEAEDYYPEDYYSEDPYEDHNKRRMNPKFVQKVSKAEADKLISKSIANTLTNFKDSNGKKGKGIYFCC